MKNEYDNIHLADIAWFQNDFINIVVFLFLTMLIEYLIEKFHLTKKVFWLNHIIEFAKVIIAITLASATISYWDSIWRFIWQHETCRIYNHLLTAFTLLFNAVSAYLFISFDPITPLIKQRLSGKPDWKSSKAKLLGFIFVNLLLSLKLPFNCDNYPFLLPVWVAVDIIIWIRYFQYLVKLKWKEKTNSVQTSPYIRSGDA